MRLTHMLPLLALAACGPTMTEAQWQDHLASAWTKPGAALGDARRDRAACQYEADKASAAASDWWKSIELLRECMEVRGWTRVSK